jgi:Family of unknown function (DUF6178)
MPKTAYRGRRRQTPEKTIRRKARAGARRPGAEPARGKALDRIARAPDAAQLARVVPHLAPETLHALVRHQGLDASGDLVAAATPDQLTAVFDIDLWRPSQSGRDERFDADRFGEWVEALVESDELLAARTIAALDEDLVIAGLSRYVRVFDPAALLMSVPEDEAVDLDVPSFTGPAREVGGYVVRARRTDAWDAIVALLFALAEHHPDCFHDVLSGCRRLSNSTPEIDGLDDLLMAPQQLMHDVAAERDRRRSQQGYATPADARAFLQMARQRRGPAGAPRTRNPIVAAYFRAAGDDVEAADRAAERPAARVKGANADERESVEALVALLGNAGLPTERPKALLAAPSADRSRPTRVETLLAEVDEVGFAARSRELAFLANVLVAGGSVQSRAFTPREASEAAIAICNLGLEHSPTPDSTAGHDDLVAAFEIGWAVLHELGMFVATKLNDMLTDLRSVDPDTQQDLVVLRSELVRQCENGTPWRARAALEVIAVIDMPVFVSLQALLDECPVLPDALTAILEHRTGAIDPTAFEFISTGRQVRKVREFAGTLLDALTR